MREGLPVAIGRLLFDPPSALCHNVLAPMQQVPRLEDLIREYTTRRAELDAHGVYFLRDITDEQAEAFSKAILIMSATRSGRPDLPITVFVNSGGGSVGAGLAVIEMINRMRRQFGVVINTAVTGYAYSMGAIVVQAGDQRTMGKLSTMMLHAGTWILTGDAEKIFQDYHKLATHYEEVVSDLFARRTKKHDAAWWKEFVYSGRERFLSAAECLELGLVDEVIDLPLPA